jgi:TatD DNase family protein
MITITDTHCHLNHADFCGDLPQVLTRAKESGVGEMICVGYDLESSAEAIHLARDIPVIHASVGIHPHDASGFTPEAEVRIRAMAADREHVVAIGETGLDYYRNISPKEAQHDAFRRQINVANELNLPLIVHSRDAQDDVLAMLEQEGLPPRGVVMHCLPADRQFALKAIEMGCFVGIAGPVTFKNAGALRDIVAQLPTDRLLLETDCPYLTPHPHRGRRNEPSYLPLVASAVAELHGVSYEELASITTSNARRLFGIGSVG